MRNAFRSILVLLILLAALMAASAQSNKDWLAGLGSFERCSYTRWYSLYSPAQYDYASNPRTAYFITQSGITDGYNTSSADDTVADGWTRVSNNAVHPVQNVVCRLVASEGVNQSNAQYLALKGPTTAPAVLTVETHLLVDNNKAYALHTGDRVTFAIDKVKMSGFAGLPLGAMLEYNLQLVFDNGSVIAKQLNPQALDFSTDLSATVPAGATDMNIRVKISAAGNIGQNQPGIYIDGAHIFVKRTGQADYEQWPGLADQDRGIKQQMVHFAGDVHTAVRRYDDITLDAASYAVASVFRNLNPNTRLFLYCSGETANETKDAQGKDKLHGQAAFSLTEVKTNNPTWLYNGGRGLYGYVNSSDYPDRYLLKLTNRDYQDLWAQRVIERVKRYGLDGVWADDLVSLVPETDEEGFVISPEIRPSEIQQFLHRVVPLLRAEGIKVIHNAATHTIGNSIVGKDVAVYFDPAWVPTNTYPASAGYTPNSPTNTPDIWLQEYSFFKFYNGVNLYDPAYWLACLNDMETIRLWNAAVEPSTGLPKLAANQKKYMHLYVKANNTVQDPATGIDGWLQYGLCSYLLAQNEWTYFGYVVRNDITRTMDVSITKRLGDPDGTHMAYGGDNYCRYRMYKPNSSGGVGGVVVVNANHSVSRTYTLNFDAIDESGREITNGTVITLKPHTGRIFLRNTKDVSVRVSAPSATVTPGQELNVTVEYSNVSGGEVTNFVLRAQVPDQTTYVSGSAEAGGGRFDPVSNFIEWSFPRLAAGAAGVKTFKARVK